MTCVAAMVALSTVPRTRTLAPFFTALAEAEWVPFLYFVEDASVTVTSTPVAVAKVKPDVDVVSTMPVAPPAAGPDRAPPPDPAGGVNVAVGEDVAVAERDDADDEKSAAADVPAVSPATAHVSPAATIHPPFFFDSNRRTLGRRACTAMVAGADPAGEWLVGSKSFMTALLIAWATAQSLSAVHMRTLWLT
jgi:hypothetical protein